MIYDILLYSNLCIVNKFFKKIKNGINYINKNIKVLNPNPDASFNETVIASTEKLGCKCFYPLMAISLLNFHYDEIELI